MLTERLNDKVIIVTGGSGLIGIPIIAHLKNNKAIVINAAINITNNPDLGEYK